MSRVQFGGGLIEPRQDLCRVGRLAIVRHGKMGHDSVQSQTGSGLYRLGQGDEISRQDTLPPHAGIKLHMHAKGLAIQFGLA